MYCLNQTQKFVCRNDGREEKALLEAGEPPHSSGKRVSKPQLHPWHLPAPSPLLQPEVFEMLHVLGLANSQGFTTGFQLHQTGLPMDLPNPCGCTSGRSRGCLQTSACSRLPSKRKTAVTQDISRLAAIPAIAKWHICTARYSIYTQSCSNCESQAHNFIPQLF